jgi:adenine C2-methylase RlmN of 23S rRNA A2503 and tRNA A37
MQITDQVFHPRVPYKAKDFDEQEGHRFTMLVSEDKPIETGVYLHWLHGKPLDIAIDISCMSGCSGKCIFCAAGKTRPETLNADQISNQVKLAIDRVKPCHYAFFDELMTNPKITFSFQGIGEPSDPTAAPEVKKAINRLRKEYRNWKRVQFTISSTLNNTDILEEWASLNLQTLQFSLHASDDNKRRKLLDDDKLTPIQNILKQLDKFSADSPDTQIKINYLLISRINDTQDDCQELLKLFRERPNFFLKISQLNETYPGCTHRLSGSKRHAEFLSECKAEHPKTYWYGALQELQISCGQLASYAQPERADARIRQDIATLYEDIRSGQCTLFLGAGASYTAWDARGLAEKLYRELGRTTPFSETNLCLSEIADAFEHRGKRKEVDKRIRSVLRESKVPGAMFDVTRYPWRAIYTTNYDEFIERAYSEAMSSGFSEKHCHPVLQPEDLQGLGPEAMPLIKLHGSVSQGLRTVLSNTDYLNGYVESVELLLHRLAVDRLEGSLLFIGYSFRDHFLQQWLFNLKRRLTRPQGRLWAVQPERETTADDRDRLHAQFGVKLIPTDFAGLMRELEVLRRRPVIMTSGSKKRVVRGGTGTPRVGAIDKIDTLCFLIAKGLDERAVRLITGATATDKIGYLIGSQMSPQRVTTYTWRGSEHELGNELSKMIGIREVGDRPAAVIDRLLREANALLVVGGGALTLRETLSAISRGTPVIPVAVGGKFASDVVHNLFLTQYETVEALSADIGVDARFGERVIEVLTPKRLKSLQLNNLQPDHVAAAVLETLDHVASLVSKICVF